MNAREELIQMGYEIVLSVDSPIGHWGKWMIEVKHLKDGRIIASYGATESECFGDALGRAKQF